MKLKPPQDFALTVAERIRAARLANHLSLRALGRAIGHADHSTVLNYERGAHVPGGYQLSRLADALGVTTDHLLGRDEPLAETSHE